MITVISTLICLSIIYGFIVFLKFIKKRRRENDERGKRVHENKRKSDRKKANEEEYKECKNKLINYIGNFMKEKGVFMVNLNEIATYINKISKCENLNIRGLDFDFDSSLKQTTIDIVRDFLKKGDYFHLASTRIIVLKEKLICPYCKKNIILEDMLDEIQASCGCDGQRIKYYDEYILAYENLDIDPTFSNTIYIVKRKSLMKVIS